MNCKSFHALPKVQNTQAIKFCPPDSTHHPEFDILGILIRYNIEMFTFPFFFFFCYIIFGNAYVEINQQPIERVCVVRGMYIEKEHTCP